MCVIPEIELKVDLTDPKTGIQKIVTEIRPQWIWQSVQVSVSSKNNIS